VGCVVDFPAVVVELDFLPGGEAFGLEGGFDLGALFGGRRAVVVGECRSGDDGAEAEGKSREYLVPSSVLRLLRRRNAGATAGLRATRRMRIFA
jgi:hypothetical protein